MTPASPQPGPYFGNRLTGRTALPLLWYVNGMIATIDGAGRVVIPKPIRERAGLSSGTKLRIDYDDGRIVIEPAQKPAILVQEGSLLVATRPDETVELKNEDVLESIRVLREGGR